MSRVSAFQRLHPRVQQWVYDRGWTALRDAQEQAIGPILDGCDVIVSAATATGKTEAAFLPICTTLAERAYPTSGFPLESPTGTDRSSSIDVLCISPLKALIDDQWTRLEQLCGYIDVPVHRWHGDVASSIKQRLRRNPSGVLLMTPESLEATFVNHDPSIRQLFGGLQFVVVDELHSFIGTARGAQLQSLLHRVEVATGRSAPRIGLSATLGDHDLAARFLRPANPGTVRVIVARDDTQLNLELRGYTIARTRGTDTSGGAHHDIAQHVYHHLRGGDHLVFVNSRRDVETYSDLLTRRSDADHVVNEFHPHHGSLSREVRHAAETAVKDPSRPATVICTSTLELDVDIGTIQTVAQIGPPASTASLRQRFGRSGRRGDPATLRVYITEPAIEAGTGLVDRLRCHLTQTIATINLVVAGLIEPPADPGFNYSTLVQQTLSMIAARGGATPARLHPTLCGPGPFQDVDPTRYTRLLRCLAKADLIYQAADGLLLPTPKAEKLLRHPSFYAAFQTPEEWRLVTHDTTLGTLPVVRSLIPGDLLLFAGRRWRIRTVDPTRRLVELEPASGGNPPTFDGDIPEVGDHVRQQMPTIYNSNDVPEWLDAAAKILLTEARETWQQLDLPHRSILTTGGHLVILPWVSDTTLFTTALALRQHGLDTSIDGPTLNIDDTTPEQLHHIIQTVLANPPDAHQLAALIPNHRVDKWDWILDEHLGIDADTARRLNLPGTTHVLQQLHAELEATQPRLTGT